MDSETHFSIVFNIYGGSNQILPNATSATQNYYGDEAELEKDDVSMDKEPALSPEAMRLFSYINKVEDLRIYLVQIAECTNAVELARVAFLDGYYKAIAFGSGPCGICEECSVDHCRFPKKTVPSMEGCGIDVFATARNNGFTIDTVKEKTDQHNYFGLVLFE